jgi:hypothetical protein
VTFPTSASISGTTGVISENTRNDSRSTKKSLDEFLGLPQVQETMDS